MSLSSTKLIPFFALLCMQASFADGILNCPPLTMDEIKQVITNGRISTDRKHTLAVEAGKTPAEVLRDEPNANPYNTYYEMSATKKYNGTKYTIYIGNILAGDIQEAMTRAEKILVGNEVTLNAKIVNGYCLYKQIDASKTIEGYPFKSEYENVAIVAFPSCSAEITSKTMHTL